MTRILLSLCSGLLLTAGLALTTDSPADLVSGGLCICWSGRKSVATSADWLVVVCIDCQSCEGAGLGWYGHCHYSHNS